MVLTFYHYLYYCHQVLNNYYQVLGPIQYIQLQFFIATKEVVIANETIWFQP